MPYPSVPGPATGGYGIRLDGTSYWKVASNDVHDNNLGNNANVTGIQCSNPGTTIDCNNNTIVNNTVLNNGTAGRDIQADGSITTTLAASTTYYLKMTAFDSTGVETLPSSEVSFTTPSNIGGGFITCLPPAPVSGVYPIGYRVYVGTSAGGENAYIGSSGGISAYDAPFWLYDGSISVAATPPASSSSTLSAPSACTSSPYLYSSYGNTFKDNNLMGTLTGTPNAVGANAVNVNNQQTGAVGYLGNMGSIIATGIVGLPSASQLAIAGGAQNQNITIQPGNGGVINLTATTAGGVPLKINGVTSPT